MHHTLSSGLGTLAILASRSDEIELVSTDLGGRGVVPCCVATPDELWATLCETPCIGVAVSVSTLLRLPDQGKQLIRNLDQIIPVAKFKVNAAGALGVMSPFGGVGASMDEFIAACLGRGPKRFRRNERFQKHLNVILSQDAAFSSPEFTFTFDLSKDGCFAHSDHAWQVGDPVWVSIREPFRDFAIEGTVMRAIPWGMSFQPQGIGIRFREPDGAELARLIRFVSRPGALDASFTVNG
jgi:Tfp pilus assembly protein PilZ